MIGAETIRLGDEVDRLARQHDEVQARAEDADDTASGEAVRWSLNELDQQGRAVAALVEDHGPDATVTVEGLTAGEFGRVEDRVAAARAQRDGQPTMQGYHRVVYAAAGVEDAPFLPDREDDSSEREWLDAKVDAVAGLNIALVKWLYARVDDLTTVDQGNWKQSAGEQ